MTSSATTTTSPVLSVDAGTMSASSSSVRPCTSVAPASPSVKSSCVPRTTMRSTTRVRSTRSRMRPTPIVTSAASIRLSGEPIRLNSASWKFTSGPLRRQRASMPAKSTSMPIAAVAQPFMSSWYSVKRGRNRRNNPTATASRIRSPAPKYTRKFRTLLRRACIVSVCRFLS